MRFCITGLTFIAYFVSPAIAAPPTVSIAPGDHIQSAVIANPAGTTFIIKAGVHRMQAVIPKNDSRFIGEKGAILNGSRLLTAWKKEGNYWVHGGQTQQNYRYKRCVDGNNVCQYPEDLFMNDKLMRHDSTLAGVGPGEWYFDYDQDKVYVYDNPNGHKMEIGVSSYAFKGGAGNVTIKNLIVEKYAVSGHMAAIGHQHPGDGWIIENNEVRFNHGQGVKFDGRAIVRNNYIHHNGQMGLTGNGTGGLVENNEIAYNTLDEIGYRWQHEGGGTKFALTDSLVVRNNYVHHNAGPGLWTDIKNIHTLYEGNVCVDNLASGIFHEISYAAVIRCNYLSGNGRAHGGQIFLSTSKDSEVYDNVIIVTPTSGDGIAVAHNATRAESSGTNNYIHNNDITFIKDIKFCGVVAQNDTANFWANNTNRFDYNVYHIAQPGAQRWKWQGETLQWNDFQQGGQEAHGRMDNRVKAMPVYDPRTAKRTCAMEKAARE